MNDTLERMWKELVACRAWEVMKILKEEGRCPNSKKLESKNSKL